MDKRKTLTNGLFHLRKTYRAGLCTFRERPIDVISKFYVQHPGIRYGLMCNFPQMEI